LAEAFVFGSGPECPNEPLCLPVLSARYGLTFKEFRVTDAGGPRTIEALRSGAIQVGVLFTTDPHLLSGELVLLEDDQHSQPAENVTPILRSALLAAHGARLADTIDRVSSRLTTERLAELNRDVLRGTLPEAAAAAFLTAHGLDSNTRAAPGNGPPIVVSSANFAESVTVAELYAHALAAARFPVERRFGVGNRNTYFPLIRAGNVGLVAEYLGSLLGYLDAHHDAIADPQAAHSCLVRMLQGTGLIALHSAPAETKNGVVVTGGTAARYGLTKISHLGRPIGDLDTGL